MTLESFKDQLNSERIYRVGNLPEFKGLLSQLDDVSKNFELFLAMDASGLTDEELRSVARKLFDRGLTYVCIWGNECGRVHDCFDLERDPEELSGATVMTTWHSDESLEEALWFFSNCAFPDESFEPHCKDWVAIAVGNSDWSERVRKALVS